MYDEQLKKIIFGFVIVVIILKFSLTSNMFKSSNYNGNGFKLVIPIGWEFSKKDSRDLKLPGSSYPAVIATFVPLNKESKDGPPESKISIFSRKLSTAMWVEDEFPKILGDLIQNGFTILDKGEIKIDERISKWVLYHDKNRIEMDLEFYVVTDNNMFFRLQYSSIPEKFNVHRKEFEALKESFKFSSSLF